jgi:hypothetical protein
MQLPAWRKGRATASSLPRKNWHSSLSPMRGRIRVTNDFGTSTLFQMRIGSRKSLQATCPGRFYVLGMFLPFGFQCQLTIHGSHSFFRFIDLQVPGPQKEII